MSEPVQLLDPEGDVLEPNTLVAQPLELSVAETEGLRTAARRAGRVLEREGFALHGYGEAAQLELPGGVGGKGAARAAGELLGAISCQGDAVPIAFGALPFLPSRAARLVLPRLSVLRRAGCDQVIELVVGGAARDTKALLRGAMSLPTPPAPPESFVLAAVGTHEQFKARVEDALRAIDAGHFDKVVIAREVTVKANRPFAAEHLLSRLVQLHPSCLSFSIDSIVGASPELLCRRESALVTSQPLAGTVGRSGDPEQDRRLAASLLASDKERAEHTYVVEAIRVGLAPYVSRLEVPADPHLLELRNVVHLATTIEATLLDDGVGCLELVAALHPTPAVGGSPRDAALEYLARTETMDRDRYAGPVGYLDGRGDGEFWLGIRSAMLSGSCARLLAGVGIVAGSEPDAELAETQLKLQALLAAAVRP